MTLKLKTVKHESDVVYGEYGVIHFKNDWWYGFIGEAGIELNGDVKRGTLIFIDSITCDKIKGSCDFKPQEKDEEDC